MKFRIDIKYIVVQALKALTAYLIGIFIILSFRSHSDLWDIVLPSLFAGVTLFVIFMIPRSISVMNRTISFTKENCAERITIKLVDIINIETDFHLYNTLTLITRSGNKYRLHPEDLQGLQNEILITK